MVGVLAFKCAKGLATSYLSDCFVTRSTVHDRNTRNNDYLNIYSSLSIGRRSTNFSIQRAIKLWNSLPRAITATDNLRTFKKKLREFLSESFLVSQESYQLMFLSIIKIYNFNVQIFYSILQTYLMIYLYAYVRWD